jgi:hypothetical protein
MNYKEFLSTVFWADIRDAKFKINPRCERCGESRWIQVHHKFYRKESFYSVQIGDLETLCRPCHEKEHGINQKPKKGPKQLAKEARAELRRIEKSKTWQQRQLEGKAKQKAYKEKVTLEFMKRMDKKRKLAPNHTVDVITGYEI